MDVAADIQMYPELEYFMNEEKSDLVFVVDGQRVLALKQVLCFQSDVFKAMFSGNWKESNDNEVTVKDTSFEVFKSMIKFLYIGHVVVVGDHKIDFIRDMIILAERYQLTRLAEEMCDRIKENLNLDNFDDFCKMAFDLNVKQVIPVLKSYMKNNFDAFTRMDFKRLKTIDEWTEHSWLEIVMVETFKSSVTGSNQSVIKHFSKPEIEYFMNEDESDVVFIVGGQRVPAIKQVLALKSMKFRNIFETNEDAKEITLEETGFDTFKELIYFIYTENMLSDKWIINFPSSCELGCKYKVFRFVESMAKLIVITPDNFELIAQSSDNMSRQHNYKSASLLTKLKQFMDNNFKQHFYNRNMEELKRINSWTDQSLFEIIFSRLKIAEQVFGRHSFRNCTHYCQKLVTCRFGNVLETVPSNAQEITSDNFYEKFQLAFNTKSLTENLKLFIDINFKEFYSKKIDYLKKINECTDQTLFVIWIQRLKKAERYYASTHINHENHNKRYGSHRREVPTFI